MITFFSLDVKHKDGDEFSPLSYVASVIRPAWDAHI